MGNKYKIVESVGRTLQDVHSYDDLEKHHPTWKEDSKKRHYDHIDGEREEFVRSPSGERMVSKDFILMSNGSAAVDIPSPVEGYVRRNDKLDRWGTVQIYDGPGKDAHLIAQVRHMQPIHVSDGDHVKFGEPLGRQGSKSPPGTKVGLHVHMDVAEGHLKEFKQYIHDVDTGVIAPGKYPNQDKADIKSPPTTHTASRPSATDGLLEQGEHGAAVRHLQEALKARGYRDAQGHALEADGHFGARTREAVIAFQQANGLRPDGIVGARTLGALSKAEQSPLVSNANHPDNPLYQQALRGLEQLPANTFKNQTERDNAAATLAVEAKVSGLKQIDHVSLSTNGAGLFAVQGKLDDPAHQRVYADREQAATQPIERSSAQLQQDAAVQQQSQNEQQRQRTVSM